MPAPSDWGSDRPVGRPARRAAAPRAELAHDGNLEALALLLAEPLRGQAQRLARNADVQAAWAEWLKMRAERGHPRTERALKAALKVLAAMHPNPDAAYNCLDHSTDGGWQGLFPRPKALWIPLPGNQARLAAAGIEPAKAGTPTEADLQALEDYKKQAEDMSPAERAALLKKCADSLPHLSASLSARIWALNERDRKAGR